MTNTVNPKYVQQARAELMEPYASDPDSFPWATLAEDGSVTNRFASEEEARTRALPGESVAWSEEPRVV